MSQNVLMRHLNRPGINLTSLLQAVPNIVSLILKIANIFKVILSDNDINQCISIKNKNEVSMKSNSTVKRDSIVKNITKRTR